VSKDSTSCLTRYGVNTLSIRELLRITSEEFEKNLKTAGGVHELLALRGLESITVTRARVRSHGASVSKEEVEECA
jgi:hypothetical protein